MQDDLIAIATSARVEAYAPYSCFQVGAALRGKDGRVFTGCNVENISFGLTMCAERNAIFQAVAAGVRAFEVLVVVADTREPISPCGGCRQVMAEFGDFTVISATLSGKRFETSVGFLLPRGKTGILDHA
jgi:cytidine deaminase